MSPAASPTRSLVGLRVNRLRPLGGMTHSWVELSQQIQLPESLALTRAAAPARPTIEPRSRPAVVNTLGAKQPPSSPDQLCLLARVRHDPVWGLLTFPQRKSGWEGHGPSSDVTPPNHLEALLP